MTMKVYEHEDDEGCDDDSVPGMDTVCLIFGCLAGLAVYGAICLGVGYFYGNNGAPTLDGDRTGAAKVGASEGSNRGIDNGGVKVR